MLIEQQRITCKCGNVFDADVVLHAPIAVYLASLEAIRCGACGKGGSALGLGGEYPGSPPVTAPMHDRATWWRRRGEVGTSSLTIWCAFTGGTTTPDCDFNWPLDPDDFKRCRRLLDLVPEWRADLSTVTDRFPWMEPFVTRWDVFDALWDAESPTGLCYKLYALLKVAEKEAKKIRYPKDAA